MRFKITFLKGNQKVAEITSIHNTDIKISELEQIIKTEAFLERLTGLRVHIEES